MNEDVFIFFSLVIEAFVAHTFLDIEFVSPIVKNTDIDRNSHRVILIDFALSELALSFLMSDWRLDLTSSQVGCALCELKLLLSEENIGTNSVSLSLCVGLHVLVAVLTLDRSLHLDR